MALASVNPPKGDDSVNDAVITLAYKTIPQSTFLPPKKITILYFVIDAVIDSVVNDDSINCIEYNSTVYNSYNSSYVHPAMI